MTAATKKKMSNAWIGRKKKPCQFCGGKYWPHWLERHMVSCSENPKNKVHSITKHAAPGPAVSTDVDLTRARAAIARECNKSFAERVAKQFGWKILCADESRGTIILQASLED